MTKLINFCTRKIKKLNTILGILVHFETVEWYKCSALSLYDLDSEWSSEKGGKKDPINSARCIKELASWPVHSNNVLLLQMTDLF